MKNQGSKVLQTEGSKEGGVFSYVRWYGIWRSRLRKVIELHG